MTLTKIDHVSTTRGMSPQRKACGGHSNSGSMKQEPYVRDIRLRDVDSRGLPVRTRRQGLFTPKGGMMAQNIKVSLDFVSIEEREPTEKGFYLALFDGVIDTAEYCRAYKDKSWYGFNCWGQPTHWTEIPVINIPKEGGA